MPMSFPVEPFVKRKNLQPELPRSVKDSSAVGDGLVDDTNSIVDAANVVGDTGTILFPAGEYRVSVNTTVNCAVIFLYGASLKPDSGVTVTLNGPVETAPGQSIIASGTAGTVTINGPQSSGEGILNVKTFGAVGDGTTDDTAAIQAAINAAATGWTSGDPFGFGGIVYVPPGVYGVSADIDIPEQVILQGAGLRVTIIRWIGGSSPTEAVVTSNLDDRFSFVHTTAIKDLTIDANDEPVGLKIRGWNEACTLENVEVREYTDATDGGVQILSASAGSNTSTSQNAYFKGLWFGGKTGARNLLLDGCNRLTFDNVTIFLSNYNASTNPGPMLTGIELRQVCRQNVFVNANVEDCTRAYDIGTVGAVSGNTFINPLSDVPVGDSPADTTIGSVTGSMGFVVRSTAGAQWGQIVGGMRSRFYDYVYFDDALGISVAGAGGSNYSNLVGYFGPAPGPYTTPFISRHATFTDGDTTPSVARGNVFSANNSGATSITAFDDSTEFQEITIRFTNSNTTIVDAAGVIELAGGVNFAGTSNDTLTLVRYGTTWFEKARSVN